MLTGVKVSTRCISSGNLPVVSALLPSLIGHLPRSVTLKTEGVTGEDLVRRQLSIKAAVA